MCGFYWPHFCLTKAEWLFKKLNSRNESLLTSVWSPCTTHAHTHTQQLTCFWVESNWSEQQHSGRCDSKRIKSAHFFWKCNFFNCLFQSVFCKDDERTIITIYNNAAKCVCGPLSSFPLHRQTGGPSAELLCPVCSALNIPQCIAKKKKIVYN